MISRFAFDGQGLNPADLPSISPEYSIEGGFAKCCIRENGKLYLIKRGGYENVGFVSFGRLYGRLGFDAVANKYMDLLPELSPDQFDEVLDIMRNDEYGITSVQTRNAKRAGGFF